MTKFIKLKDITGHNESWINTSSITEIYMDDGKTWVYLGNEYYGVTETPEEIIALIEASESQPKPSDPIYPGFATAANLELLLNEFREFKRLLSRELSQYYERLIALERTVMVVKSKD